MKSGPNLILAALALCAFHSPDIRALTAENDDTSDTAGSLDEKSFATATFQSDGIPTTKSYLHYRGVVPQMTQLTVCGRVNFKQIRDRNTIVSYAVPGDENHLIIYFDGKDEMIVASCCNSSSHSQYELLGVFPGFWAGFCFIMNLEDPQRQISSTDPEILERNAHFDLKQSDRRISVEYLEEGKYLKGGGSLYIGQEQERALGDFSKSLSLQGTISDFRLYDQMLTAEEMRAYVFLQEFSKPTMPIINFNNISEDFIDSETMIGKLHYDRYLKGFKPFRIFETESRTFLEALQFCGALGGVITYPIDKTENEKISEEISPYVDHCGIERQVGTFWIGIMKTSKTGKWTVKNVNNNVGTNLTYSNFIKFLGQPKGQCATLISVKNDTNEISEKWVTTSCEEERCTSCNISKIMVFYLKGLCKRSLFDKKYLLRRDNNEMHFKGNLYSEIRFHKSENNDSVDYGFWEITTSLNDRATAILKKRSPKHLPFGINSWEIKNDACGWDSITEKNLKFSVCDKYSYTCNDGTCVKPIYRCDGLVDCTDGSDEIGCLYVSVPENYDTSLPPPTNPLDNLHNPVEVMINVTILSVKNLSITGFQINLELHLDITWYDQRLSFFHLKWNYLRNRIEEYKIWKPPVQFFGDEGTFGEVMEKSNMISVLREDAHKPRSHELFEEGLEYSSTTNHLLQVKVLVVSSACNFKLFFFPFDVQTCIVKMEMPHVQPLEAGLHAQNVTFLGTRTLLQYHLDKEVIYNSTCKHQSYKSCITIELTFSNLSKYFLSSTYLPTFIVTLIGYMSFFFPLDDFSDRFIVSLTGLLVEAAFFMQTNSSIPQTAYIKMIDIWFMFCIVYFFLLMTALLLINKCREIGKRNNKSLEEVTLQPRAMASRGCCSHIKGISSLSESSAQWSSTAVTFNRLCRVLFPLLQLIFIIFYSIYALVATQE